MSNLYLGRWGSRLPLTKKKNPRKNKTTNSSRYWKRVCVCVIQLDLRLKYRENYILWSLQKTIFLHKMYLQQVKPIFLQDVWKFFDITGNMDSNIMNIKPTYSSCDCPFFVSLWPMLLLQTLWEKYALCMWMKSLEIRIVQGTP